MKNKLLLFYLVILSAGISLAQNGTRPDEAKVIVGSRVVRTIPVLDNDNLVAGKSYQLTNVYQTAGKNIIIAVEGNNVTYQCIHNANASDTFYYIARDINSNTFDTNTVVVRKDELPRDLRPGDANKDNICNNIDVLNIGIAYGKTEIAREGDYINDNFFFIHKAYDWSLANLKSNYKFSDANGDGTVDSIGDITTILKNYNKEHALKNVHYSPTGGSSLIISSMDTIETFTSSANFPIKINLGNSVDRLKSIYGLAFTLKYNPNSVKATDLKFSASKWFEDNSSTLNFSYNNTTAGELDITIVRKNGLGGIGYGELGVVDVVIIDILDKVNLDFEITKPVLIDSIYNVLPINLPNSKRIHAIKKSSSKINTSDKQLGIKYYINDQKLSLKNENPQPTDVSIVNILGKEVMRKIMAPNQSLETDTQQWSSGVYFIKTTNEAYKIHVK